MTIPGLNGRGSASNINVGDIGHSLRFRSSASAYLSRTPGVAGDRKTWTWSGWVKRGTLGASQALFHAGSTGSSSDVTTLVLRTTDNIQIVHNLSATTYVNKITNAVYRDPSSHIHVVLAWDSTPATPTQKLYINGVEVTSWGTNTMTLAQNADCYVNSTSGEHRLGRDYTTSYLDGYLSRVCFVDGQALTPSSFGYLNSEINEWVSKSQSQVKAVVDAGGTNSFMLDFDNAAGLTELGYDKSSKGNNWTCNNISLTAGTTYDHMLDVPGNSYATLNPLWKSTFAGGSVPTADGDLVTFQNSTALWAQIISTVAVDSGKWYWEVLATNTTTSVSYLAVGVARPQTSMAGTSMYPGFASDSWAYHSTTGLKWNNNTSAAYGASYQTNDIIGVALDIDAGTLVFYKNNVNQGTAYSGLTGSLTPVVGSSGGVGTCNFGQRPFAYTPPTGFKALCQANLPDPAILNPKKHFDVVTRTGTAATYSVAGLGFQPDFVWTKSRGRAVDHALYDSNRGVQKRLETNNTDAEVTGDTTGITAFNSDGYTGGALDQINGTTATNSFVDWLWKAGGAAVSNTAGSITSQVSANTKAGFSIVTYTGTGANATVGHGLGTAPKMVIVKNRGGTTYWPVYHQYANATPQNGFLYLNDTPQFQVYAAYWNNTAPTTTTFSLGTDVAVNTNGNGHVAYCFAEVPGFSKFGSYTGNGSTDGPFVYCGFKPRYVLIKRADVAASWYIHDAARDLYNGVKIALFPNLTNAESSWTTGVDILSNGFKWRETSTDINASGGTYIFAAFADVSGKYSNAR